MYYQYNNNDRLNDNFHNKQNINKTKTNYLWKNAALSSVFIISAVLLLNSIITYKYQSNDVSIQSSKFYQYSTLNEPDIQNLFIHFKQNYSISYATDEEEEFRYENFKNFLAIVDTNNENEIKNGKGTAVHGITKFADLTEKEFNDQYLGYNPDTEYIKTDTRKLHKKDVTRNFTANITGINWADIYTTQIKDQGYCGSCWAFSLTQQIESDSIRNHLLTIDDGLSVEQIVQCDSVDSGCDGGNTVTAFEYVKKAGGIQYESDYPYTSYYGVDGVCNSNSSNYAVTVEDYYSITGEEDMADYVISTGTLSICLAASTWYTYQSGIISTCDNNVDHCVQIVGVNMKEGYWIVRNSWGTDWGLDGYIWIEYGSDLCSITYDPIYLSVKLAE